MRNCGEQTRRQLDAYVAELEATGHDVHYPPRDVDQTDDGSGRTICVAHRTAMLAADEIHVWWDSSSLGSHFDFGMAWMLRATRALPLIVVNAVSRTKHKSYGNVLLDAAKADK